MSTINKRLSVAMENYLELIYSLSPNNTGVHLTDLSKLKGVSKASVSSAIDVLANNNFVEKEHHYSLIRLTPAGLDYALETNKKHQIIKNYFLLTLNIDEELADKEACIYEHIISKELLKKMEEYLLKFVNK